MSEHKYQRDELLKDLQNHVINVLHEESGRYVETKLSLRPDLLPKSYLESQKRHVEEFHHTNKEMLSGWDMFASKWVILNVESVRYVEVCPGFEH